MSYSKTIKKGDDSSKLFIQKCLNGAETHGFDHDSVYCVQGRYYLFEYLKCESKYMTPHTSNPKYYPYNWKKFYSLWQTAKRLQGYLLLVNYSDREQDCDQVKLMYVTDFDYQALEEYLEKAERMGARKEKCQYLIMKEYNLSFQQFSAYLRYLNDLADLPEEETEEVPDLVLSMINAYSQWNPVRHPVLPK